MPPEPYDWDDDEQDSDEFDFEEFDTVWPYVHKDDDDDDEQLYEIERAYRHERATILACEDLRELRRLRRAHQELADSDGREAGRIRALDLVELIDERITDLRARRMASRSR